MTCYQQPTNDALLAVMSEERKVRDTAIVAFNSAEEVGLDDGVTALRQLGLIRAV